MFRNANFIIAQPEFTANQCSPFRRLNVTLSKLAVSYSTKVDVYDVVRHTSKPQSTTTSWRACTDIPSIL
jgi:hypothetical protein